MKKPPFPKREHKNLVQTIRLAESQEEINMLLAVGNSLEHASDKTRSRWHEAAKARRSEIGHSADTAE